MIEPQRLGAQIVEAVLDGRSLDRELASVRAAHGDLTAHDRALLQDIAYGTLRFLGEIDGVLNLLLERPPRDERVRHLLRVALYQLLRTRAAPHAVVDHAVRTCALEVPPAKGLVNAVLRNFLRRREELLTQAHATDVGRYSHSQWWVDKLRAEYPARYADMLTVANAHPPLTLRVNTRRASVDEYLARLATAELQARRVGDVAVLLETPVPVERIPGFAEGVVSVQDAAAQLAATFLDAKPGERVLDACAAPGGKTAHLLERADIDLLAIDVEETRLARVQSNLARLQLTARVSRGDASRTERWWDGVPFGAILADVPCSASGVVRRHPDIKWLRRPDDLARFADKQREILDALWQTLASGGKLLYVTCSIFHEENQNQIARFLERHHDAQCQPLPWPADVQHDAGQILPDEQHDGFFYALLQKA